MSDQNVRTQQGNSDVQGGQKKPNEGSYSQQGQQGQHNQQGQQGQHTQQGQQPPKKDVQNKEQSQSEHQERTGTR